MLKRRGARTDPCGTPFLRRRNLILLPFPVVRVKLRLPTISTIMSIMQEFQQLAGEAGVPYSIVGSCEVDKQSSGLLFNPKAILDVPCQQGDLVYGRPPVSKARLLQWEQWVDDWIDTSVDEDFKGNTQQRYGTVALLVPQWLIWLEDRNSQLLMLFSRSLEFWVGSCRNWGSRKTKIWEPTLRGV